MFCLYPLQKLAELVKSGRKSKSFTEKNYPEKAKEIYRSLKREYGEEMPAEVKARIALARAKGKKPGTGYTAPLRYRWSSTRKKYVSK